MSSRGQHVGSAPTSGIYTPTPTPAENDDLPTYINDELLRLGGILNGILEGGALPPQTELPKRVREGMIIYFTVPIPDSDVDVAGIWLYRKGKWWKLLDDPSEILDIVSAEITRLENDLKLLNEDLKHLNDVLLPQLAKDLEALNKELDDLNNITLPQLEKDLAKATEDIKLANADLSDLNDELKQLEGKFPITSTEITDGAISTPKLAANSVTADKIVANSIGADKIVANSITGDKIVANTITGDKLVANSISGDKIQANSISGDKLTVNSISGDKIVANSINGDKLIANSIAGDKILANTIGADKLVANTITGDKISAATNITAGTGNASAHLDGADATWRIYAGNTDGSKAPFRVDKDGNVYAATGTFGGTIYAAQLSGDIVDIVTVDKPQVDIPAKGEAKKIVWQDYLTVTIPASTFDRTLKLDPIRFRLKDDVYATYWLGVYDGTTEIKKRMVHQRPNIDISSSSMVWSTGKTAKTFKIKIGRELSAAGGRTLSQDISVSIFKQGATGATIS